MELALCTTLPLGGQSGHGVSISGPGQPLSEFTPSSLFLATILTEAFVRQGRR